MRNRWTVVLVLALFLLGGFVMTGCGSSDDAEPLVVTGTWRITAIGYPILTAVLTHFEKSITGTVSDNLDYAVSITGSTTASAGETSPRNITLRVTFSDSLVLTLSGTVSDDNSKMSGRYSDSQGSSDTWEAKRQ